MNNIQSIIIKSIIESKIDRDEDYIQIIENVNLDFKYESTDIVIFDNLEYIGVIRDMLESDKTCDNKFGICIISEICCNEKIKDIVYKSDLILILLESIIKNRDNWKSIYGLAILLYLSEINTLVLKEFLNKNKLEGMDASLVFYNIVFENTGSVMELIHSQEDSLYLRVKRLLSNKIYDNMKYDINY